MKKRSIPLPKDALFLSAIKECLEAIMGRRGGKVERPVQLSSVPVTGSPSATEFNALRGDVEKLRSTVTSMLEQLEDL